MPVDILDSEGKTPLQECVFNGNPDTDHYFWRVQYLLQIGANPNAVDGRNSLKTRPLYLATMPYGNRIPRSVRKIVNLLEAASARSTHRCPQMTLVYSLFYVVIWGRAVRWWNWESRF
jgi:hypothetical protein